jgi:uncharacterized repeat protein (TIGR04138 family)
MQKLDFAEAVQLITETDSRYERDAYSFVKDAVELATKARKRQMGEVGHVTGQQICEGARQLALKQFGPMVPTVFEFWGIAKTEDFGEIVWNLIEIGFFGKSETDSRADFKAVYSFKDAFVAPFLPTKVSRRGGAKSTSPAKS